MYNKRIAIFATIVLIIAVVMLYKAVELYQPRGEYTILSGTMVDAGTTATILLGVIGFFLVIAALALYGKALKSPTEPKKT